MAMTRQLVGITSGRLTVLERSGTTADGHAAWLCSCECGNQKKIATNSLTRKSPVRSCGCLNWVRAQDRKRAGGPWNESKSYAIEDGVHCYKNRAAWARAAIRHYGNCCQRCGWQEARCDVHHRIRKSQGGPHTIANAIVLCPNCHRVEHEKAPS